MLVTRWPGRFGSLVFACLALACTGDLQGERVAPNSGGMGGSRPSADGSPMAMPVPTPSDGGTTSPPHDPPGQAPATPRRLTHTEYAHVVQDLLGLDISKMVQALPADPEVAGFFNTGNALLPTDVGTEVYARLAGQIVAALDWPALQGRYQAQQGCILHEPRCYDAFIHHIGTPLLRRPPTEQQLGTYRKLFLAAKAEGDPFWTGARLVVEALLQAPQFLYRLERPVKGQVDGYDLASRLSFLAWGSAPDAQLLAAAPALVDPAKRASELTRLLADPRARRAWRSFVTDWLRLDRLASTERDPTKFPAFSPALAADMREETLRLFERLAFEGQNLLTALTIKQTQATPALAAIYGLPSAGAGIRPYDLARAKGRMGFLTHPGILTMSAVEEDRMIIDRALFVFEELLCEHFPPPPPNVVNMEPPARKGLNDRDRLAQHRANPACAACHDRLDPMGYAFESFDAIGRFRTEDPFGNPVRTDGTMRIGDQTLNFATIEDFARGLAAAPQVASCVVEKVVQHAWGRPLTTEDHAWLEPIETAFSEGHRFADLMTALVQQPAFTTAAP